MTDRIARVLNFLGADRDLLDADADALLDVIDDYFSRTAQVTTANSTPKANINFANIEGENSINNHCARIKINNRATCTATFHCEIWNQLMIPLQLKIPFLWMLIERTLTRRRRQR